MSLITVHVTLPQDQFGQVKEHNKSFAMSRNVPLLENVKFLTVSNRSHTENSLNPRNFEIVNAVIRELEVDVLILKSRPAAIVPAISVLHSVEPAVTHEPEYYSLVEAGTCNTKIPFLACLQYENLKESKNIIQKLIKSIADSEVRTSDVAHPELSAQSVENIDVQQCQVLAELTEWRLKMNKELSIFGPPNIALAGIESGGADMESKNEDISDFNADGLVTLSRDSL